MGGNPNAPDPFTGALDFCIHCGLWTHKTHAQRGRLPACPSLAPADGPGR
jgi:hypothetical protein